MPSIRIKTNYGTMIAELYPEKAPATVANFMRYVSDGFYDNTLFHRVIPNFMVQGGGLEPGMYLKATAESVENEAANGLKNEKFTLAMARTPDPHSATSQFFINVADNAFLDYTAPSDEKFGYCVFGKLTDGVDIALRISEAPTESRANYQDVPSNDVIIEVIEPADDTGDDVTVTESSD